MLLPQPSFASDLPDGTLRPVQRPASAALLSFRLDPGSGKDRLRVLLGRGDPAASAQDASGFRIQPSFPAPAAPVERQAIDEPPPAPAPSSVSPVPSVVTTVQPSSMKTAPQPVLPSPSPPSIPEAFGTTSHYVLPFLEERDASLAAIQAAAPQEVVARQLDHAQFLIAHMMVAEARAVLATIRQRGPLADAVSRDRALGYAAILSSLAGQTPADPLPPSWQGDPLWPRLVAGTHVGAEPGGADLRAAVAALSRQSRAVATAILPALFEQALQRGETEVAAEMLAAAPTGTDLGGTARLDFMRGRLALAQGGEEMAFDLFARLAEGPGRVAVEARLALADMALSRNDPALLPGVRDLLRDGLADWRGDEAALRLRVRLARVAEDIGDMPTAVQVMAMIRLEHPGTPEAALAEDRLGGILGRLADRIAGDMPLDAAVATVRRLDPLLSGRDDWRAVRTRLAERFAAAGLAQAAQAEYADMRSGHAGAEGTAGDFPTAVVDETLPDSATLPELLDAARHSERLSGERGRLQAAVVERLAGTGPIEGPLSVDRAASVLAAAEATGTAIKALLGQAN